MNDMAQMVNAARRPDLGAGVAPLKGEAAAPALPVLDSILPIADSTLADYEALRYAHRRSAASEAIDIDLERAEELLSRSAAPAEGANHLAAVRAQLATVVQGLAAHVPMHEEPPEPVTVGAPLPQDAAPPMPPTADERPDRMARKLARRVVDLTLRAEAAEARLAALQAQWEAEMATQATLGRRFGREPHESFAAFVARLGMAAKAVPLNRSRTTRPGGIDAA